MFCTLGSLTPHTTTSSSSQAAGPFPDPGPSISFLSLLLGGSSLAQVQTRAASSSQPHGPPSAAWCQGTGGQTPST